MSLLAQNPMPLFFQGSPIPRSICDDPNPNQVFFVPYNYANTNQDAFVPVMALDTSIPHMGIWVPLNGFYIRRNAAVGVLPSLAFNQIVWAGHNLGLNIALAQLETISSFLPNQNSTIFITFSRGYSIREQLLRDFLSKYLIFLEFSVSRKES
ncbi:hypothetical protein Pyn_38862 [Prunus yedoensis var. nudiflora]|uniref:Uncharacterized protein n=1 Tax=Prunus yedoensis var. nudiflora TaxID=2094558 RepID=A0A314ZKT3_PRUYE|nr:hypothetical protein Pyn_11940 [Prunus yedoensis var. nudiflora]PQQ17994.1 hypothetical protein Pyn_38862 [Prunus yedoensis var. nudiflora]